MILGWRKKRPLIDQQTPKAPYFLAAEDLFIQKHGKEIYVKHIFSTAKDLPKYGPVIMSPGLCSNANLFRLDQKGRCLAMDHNRSFANLLAAHGFDVYLYHPGYSERVQNRYVSRHCKGSMYYKKRYRVSPEYDYKDMINFEVPAVIDFVCSNSRAKEISWIGYSLGGMIAYSYLSKHPSNPIKNLITIGSPMALNQIVFKFIPFVNFTSKILGVEEDAVLGNLSQNMVPLTRSIRALPDWFVRFNLISPYLFNPLNINNATIKTMLGNIVEPMPKQLQKFFSNFIKTGYSSQEKITNYLDQLRLLKKSRKNFLFFYGASDLIATPESVFLAREIISPKDPYNLIGVPSAGHIDLIVGKNAFEQVWKPAMEWLKDQQKESS
ncbi:MAG: alpha/beta fold hydrolase [Desulfobacteraceae bacterium]|jgi:pimeloyl-ACP methyl ester carboxylesterase|nr:alpha/beta fold hydrolase [Desulfobacteraceae bacterium]